MFKKWLLILLYICTTLIIIVVLGAQWWPWRTPAPVTPVPASTGRTLAKTERGDPLPTLNADELAQFEEGKEEFQSQDNIENGVGPIFNDRSCVNCHNQVVGGGSAVFETRFGRNVNGVFDPLEELGGSLRQTQSIGFVGAGCFFQVEQIPREANVVALRRTTPLFGLGLVDVMPDNAFFALAAAQPASVRGRPSMVFNISLGRATVSKFGWKAHVPSLFQFSGDAYRNEMGITNPEFPAESCPNAADDCALALQCDPVPGLDDDGEDVQLFFQFMRFLAPSPRGPIGARELSGEKLFASIGCAVCHTPTMTTPNTSDIPQGLRNITFHPYSDFLLHNVGPMADQIGQADASPTEMRTAPLWGTRFNNPLLHDGRVADVSDAIRAHAGQATSARNKFFALTGTQQEDIRAFLRSL